MEIEKAAAVFLGFASVFAAIEKRSSSLIPKSMLMWPLFLGLAALIFLAQGMGGKVNIGKGILGIALFLIAAQSLLVNIRRLTAWPSTLIWLGLVIAGMVQWLLALTQASSELGLFLIRMEACLWSAIGVTRVLRERSPSMEGGQPAWMILLLVQSLLIFCS